MKIKIELEPQDYEDFRMVYQGSRPHWEIGENMVISLMDKKVMEAYALTSSEVLEPLFDKLEEGRVNVERDPVAKLKEVQAKRIEARKLERDQAESLEIAKKNFNPEAAKASMEQYLKDKNE
jgi:hypothetical protein